jgi:two-component system, OmpR family, response regulator VicR
LRGWWWVRGVHWLAGMVRILVVDDEPQIGSALRRLLRREGYEVQTALTGEEALVTLQGFAADVVLSDFRMPGMTGAELLGRVKRTHPLTLRIIISGHADFKAVLASVNEGEVCRFITKPWDDGELVSYLRTMLQQRETLEQLYRPFATPRPGLRADPAYREGSLLLEVEVREPPFEKEQALALLERLAGVAAGDGLGMVGGLLERHRGRLSFVAEVGGAQRLKLELPPLPGAPALPPAVAE